MKLRSMVKTPLVDISHKNASIIRKQKSAGRQVRVVEKSQDRSKKLLVTPGIKKSKISTHNTHLKKTSAQSGKVSKIKHSAAKRKPVLKAGRGKKSQSRNTKLAAAANVLLTGLGSIVSPTVIKKNRYKVTKDAQKSVRQKPVILSNAQKSFNSQGEVSRNEFSLISENDFSRIGKKPAVAKLPVSQTNTMLSVVTKQPTIYNNVASVNSASSFTFTGFRKQLFPETQNQVKSSDSANTSIASLRFERTKTKEHNGSKISKQIQSVSKNMNYIASTNYISFYETSTHTETSVSNTISANKSPGFKKLSVGKDNITENITPQSRTVQARNQTRYVLENKQNRIKTERGKAKRKCQVTKVGAIKQFGRKQTQPLARKHKEVVRNSKTLRGGQKPTQSSKKRIPRTSSVAKKSKSRSDVDKKKTAVVEVSEVPVYIPKRLQKMAKETRPVNKLSPVLTLKSQQTDNKKQFAGLTKTTAKKTVVKKQRKFTSKDHLPQNKSLRALKQYTPLLAIEVTPIQSLAKRSPRSAMSSPTIVSSPRKAAKQTTLSQSKKNEDLNQREIMLPSENVPRQSYDSKFTSTPILAYSLYRIEEASPISTRKNMASQLRKKSATKQTKKKTVVSKSKLSKKSVSSVLNRHPKDFSRQEKSLISLRKKGPSLQYKVKKPVLRRAGKREFLPEISVKTVAKSKTENKTHGTYSVGKKPAANYGVSNKYSEKNAKLGVKLKGRKPSSPSKQITGRARMIKDAKINLSCPEQTKALKTASRRKVTETSYKLQNLPKANKLIKLTKSKTIPTKKSGKLSTKADKRKSLKGMTTSLVKATEVQAGTMVIPRQIETPKSKTLIKRVQQTIFSSSQKKIITQSNKKVTKAVHGKIVVSEISPKLSSKGGIKKKTQKKLRLGRDAKVEMINWLTPRQNKALQILSRKTPSQEARYVVSSQNLTPPKISVSKRYLHLPKIKEGRKQAAQSKKQTRAAKTTAREKINLVSQEQKKSAAGNKIQKTKSSTSPKKMGKEKLNKVANNLLLNKVNKKLSKRAKATKLIVPSVKINKLGKVKEIERIGLVALGQKKTLEASSHGGCKIAITKSSTLTKKIGKKALNKNKNSGKKSPHRIRLNRGKRRTAVLSLPKIKVNGKAKEIDNIGLVMPGQIEESKRSLSVYKMQKAKSSSAQKKTQRKKAPSKINGEVLSKEPAPKLSIKRTSSPNISRFIKAKQNTIISLEQDEAPEPLPGKYNTQKTKIISLSKKLGKKKAIREKCILSNKVNSKISAKMKRRKSVAVSQKITRLGRSKDIKEFLSASLGKKEALKLSPPGCTTRKTKLSATPKKIEKKKTIKKIPSKNKIHSNKSYSKVYVNIDASISSPTTGRSTSNKGRTYSRYSLIPQELKETTKQLSVRQKNKKRNFTDVPKRASLGVMPNVLHTRGVKSTEGTSNVSFQLTDPVFTTNKSHGKSQPSRKISTVLPFNLVNKYASSETSPSQLNKRTTLMKTDIIYKRQVQNISSPTRKTAQATPGNQQPVYEGLGRRSLLLSDTSLEWKMAVPLDTEIAVSGYRRKDKISLLPEEARAESYVCNVSYTRNDREDGLPVSRTTKSPQTSSKNIIYSEQSRKVSTSKVSFSSPIGNVDGHTRYIASTPFPVRGNSAVSSMHFDSFRNSDSNVETINGSRPLLSYRHTVTRNLRLSNPVTSHMVSERENDKESVEDSYTDDRYRVETEEKKKLYINREEEEEIEELEENTHVHDVYVEEMGKDDSRTLSPNSHVKQCIVS